MSSSRRNFSQPERRLSGKVPLPQFNLASPDMRGARPLSREWTGRVRLATALGRANQLAVCKRPSVLVSCTAR